MANIESSSDAGMIEKADAFRTDKPCISEAMKSFLSVLIAEDITKLPSQNEQHPNVTHIRDGITISQPSEPVLNRTHLLTCARAILKHINLFEPKTEAEWTEKYPQGGDETGLARIDAIAEFRVARLLSAQVKKAGAKITKLFGGFDTPHMLLQTNDVNF